MGAAFSKAAQARAGVIAVDRTDPGPFKMLGETKCKQTLLSVDAWAPSLNSNTREAGLSISDTSLSA